MDIPATTLDPTCVSPYDACPPSEVNAMFREVWSLLGAQLVIPYRGGFLVSHHNTSFIPRFLSANELLTYLRTEQFLPPLDENFKRPVRQTNKSPESKKLSLDDFTL